MGKDHIMFKWPWQKEKINYIDVKLHCLDGEDESLGFHLPEELDQFLGFIGRWSRAEGYSFTARRTSIEKIRENSLKG